MDDLVELSRQRIERGSKSFAMAARLFPPDVRASAYMLYAWCRHCDDVVDDQVLGHRNPSATQAGPNSHLSQISATVDELERRTKDACNGSAEEAVFRALALVCEKHAIPARHPLELIAGFRMDADGRNYVTLEDTLEYGYHVAGVVGVMMTMVMGARERETLERASDLGIAFQLTNIARDVVSDHAAGRVYLPAAWLHEEGISHETMTLPENRAALFRVTERLLDVAETYYASARVGLGALPFRNAWAVASAERIYRAIGEQVRQLGPAAWDGRAHPSTAAKLGGAASALALTARSRIWQPAEAAQSERDGLWTMPAETRGDTH